MAIYEEKNKMVEAYYYDGDAKKFIESLPELLRRYFVVKSWTHELENGQMLYYVDGRATLYSGNSTAIFPNTYVEYNGIDAEYMFTLRRKEEFERQYREIEEGVKHE